MDLSNSEKFTNNFLLSSLIEDPYKETGKNLDLSTPVFFHGTRSGIITKIHTEGFLVKPERPVFSLDPVYSLGYCRKSESYLRGLITTNNQKQLEEEIKILLNKEVITKEDLEDEKYMWWINKANAYYESQSDIICEGSLLVFPWKNTEMKEAPESTLYFKHNNNEGDFIEGAPSYWRTRQYFPNITKSKNVFDYAEIELTESFIRNIKTIYSVVKKGKLTNKLLQERDTAININLKVDNVNIVGNSLKEVLVEQTIESSVLRELRDLFIGALKSKGLKVYWNRNGKYLEDTRWSLSQEEIDNKIKNLQNNIYPNSKLTEFVNQKVSLIRGF